MRRRARRNAGNLIVVVTASVVVAACGAERSAPVVTRPPAVTTTEAPDESTETTVETSAPEDSGPTTDETTSTTTTTVVTPPPEAWAAFDDALSSRLIGSGDFAAAVAVSVHGEIVHTGAFGYRVPPPAPPPPPPGETVAPTATAEPTTTTTIFTSEPPDPIEKGDRFRIASISKVITATVVLQLVEAGQLQLDAPVGESLAAHVETTVSDPAVAGITVRELLSHTSGLPEYERTFFGGAVDSCPAAAQRGLSGGLTAPPGTTYHYSNLNFCLLGLLVEEVAGRPYEDVVQDRLLQPLGIEGMRMVRTFDPNPAEVLHPSIPLRNYMEVLGAAGSWVATPSDVVTIVNSLDPAVPGWHPLSAAMMEMMRQPVATAPYPNPGRWYGLGLMAFEDGSYGHTGTVENTHAMVVDRPDGVTWSVLVSGEYPGQSGDLREIFDDSIARAGISLT